MILPSRSRGESAYSDDYGVLFFSQARLISARLDVAKPCEVAARKWERIGYFGTFRPKRNNYGLKIPLGEVKRIPAAFAANEATRALGANAQRKT